MKKCNNSNNGCNNMPELCGEQVDMTVCGRYLNLLPMLQTYTTKVLKPNMCCCKNILKQSMMTCENYKYVILWDFDLNGQTITVPKNCILEFDGGSLKNGTIIGQDTVYINVGDVDIWGEDLVRGGTWREHSGGGGHFEQVQSDWNQTDDTQPDYIKNKPNIPQGVIVDDHLDLNSENPVQNKVISQKVAEITENDQQVTSNIAQLNARVATDESAAAATKVLLEGAIEEESRSRSAGDSALRALLDTEIENRQLNESDINDRLASLDAGINNTYTKAQLEALLVNTPESDVVIVQGQAGVDPTTLLPNPGTSNTLYRIMSESGDSFTEYGWNGTTYIPLAIHNTGVDQTPTPDSSKFVLSDGVAKALGWCDIKNGTIQNPGNAYCVRTWFVPTAGMKAVKIETNRPAAANCNYLFGFTLISSLDLLYTMTTIQEQNPAFVDYETLPAEKQFRGGIVDLTKYNNVVGVGFSITEVNKTTNIGNALRKSDFDGYYVRIVDACLDFSYIEQNNLCQLVNGSSGNPANGDAVNTWYVPINNAKSVHFETNRPNKVNCEYRVGWYTLKTNDFDYRQTVQVPSARIDPSLIGPAFNYNYFKDNTVLDVSNLENVVSVSCVITEYNVSTGQYSPLRVCDFDGYYVKIIRDGYLDDVVSKNAIIPTLRNGSVNNAANANNVCTEFVRFGNAKYISVITDRPNRQNCEYRYGWMITDDESHIGKTDQVQDGVAVVAYYNRANNVVDLRKYSDKVGIAFTIGEYNLITKDWEILRTTDFEDYYIKIQSSDIITPIFNTLINGESVVKCTLRNGSTGNPGNAYAVATYLIPTGTFESFRLFTDRPNAVGYHYQYTIDFSKSPYGDDGSYYYNEERSEYTDNQYLSPVFSRHFSESRGVQFGIWEVSNLDKTVYHSLRVEDFDGYNVYVIRSGVFSNNGVVTYNREKSKLLNTVSRYRKFNDNYGKDLQILIVTDTHNDNIITKRSIDALNGFPSIDILIHCGDVVGSWMALGAKNYGMWKNIVEKSSKPFYFVIGNHEAGNFSPVCATPTKADLYDNYIKPSVDAGHLVAGEYTENKCYYFHDIEAFGNFKKRIIVLDEYETPLILDNTDWIPIPYNSSLPTIQWNTSYNTGAEVNDFYYKEYSFRAAHNVTTGSSTLNDNGSGLPRYKYANRARWISQEQAQWFLNTLLSTPANYQVLVACHEPYSDNMHVVQTSKFSQKGLYEENFPNSHNYMVTDFIAEAINAFNNGTNFTINCVSKYPIDIPGYTVSADFRNKNLGTRVDAIIGGHIHKDFVWKHNTYEDQVNITPICSNANYVPQSSGSDILRESSIKSNNSDIDCYTVVTLRSEAIALVKIGVDITEDLEKRDYELIDINL